MKKTTFIIITIKNIFQVVLPRFEMQQSTNMKNVFNKMNIKTMFDLNKCDLSEMTNDKIKVDQILHAVRLKVRYLFFT